MTKYEYNSLSRRCRKRDYCTGCKDKKLCNIILREIKNSHAPCYSKYKELSDENKNILSHIF